MSNQALMPIESAKVQLDALRQFAEFMKNPQANKSPFDEDFGVERRGRKIILPEGMTYASAIKTLQRKLQEDEEEVKIFEEIEALPLEGSYALMQVLKHMFGWASAAPTPGFFGPTPPTMVNLEIGLNEHTQVIWGGFVIPNVEGQLRTGANIKDGRFVFVINGQVKQKHKQLVMMISQAVRDWLKINSIYKAKAIKVRTDENGNMDTNSPPRFMDLSGVREGELILSDDVLDQIETSIFTPIEYADTCRKNGIPLKRGVLLEGPYGTGKTLTANVTAKKCVDNGWTFIYLDKVTGLKQALLFARQYAPSVVFSEDIDAAISGERNDDTNDILNNLDGIDSKNSELMLVLTTNHVEKLDRAMLRPGRLDAIITVSPPNSAAVQKLLKLYGRDLLNPNADLESVGAELAGEIPAVIREVIERAKMGAIRHAKGNPTLMVDSHDLLVAAKSMKNHIRLLAGQQEIKAHPAEGFMDAVADKVLTKIVKERDE